eukprot:3895643-Pleurochrysis_carterae.AAC.2
MGNRQAGEMPLQSEGLDKGFEVRSGGDGIARGELPGEGGAEAGVSGPGTAVAVSSVGVGEVGQDPESGCAGERVWAREAGLVSPAEELVDGLAGGVAEVGGAEARWSWETEAVRRDGVRLFQDDAVGVGAPAAQEEGQPPESSPVVHL